MGFVNWSAFIIQLVNISIIIFVLNRFLFRPYLAYLDEETKKREQVDRDYADREEQKTAAEKQTEALLNQTKKDAQEMILQAEVLAKKETSSIIDQAKQEAEQIKVKALKDIDGEREALYKELRERVLSIALRANEKLFGKKEANAEFIAQAIKEENI